MISYRLYRLRRLIALSCAMTLGAVFLVFPNDHPLFAAAIALAIAAPVLHVLRYPTVWLETLSVAASVSVMLVVIGLNDIPTGFGSALGWLTLCAVSLIATFAVACLVQQAALLPYPVARVSLRAQGRSSVSAPQMIAQMHYENDPAWSVAPTGQDGVFALSFGTDIALPEIDADGVGLTERVEAHMKMKVLTDSETVFEFLTFEDADGPVSANRFEAEPLKNGGCRVTISERCEMAWLMLAGFWLSDGMGDYLTSHIDRAETRAPRAIRDLPNGQLIVDIARLFPAEDRSGDSYGG